MLTLIFLLCLGFLFLFLGYRIWKKEQINLIHSYHYTKVSEEDKKPYTERIGKACILIGMGILLMGLIDYFTGSTWGWICFLISFTIGFGMMIKAQKKYNNGFF